MLLAMAGLLIAWVILPLVPSVLIYKLFPSTPVAVSGPFAGLTVKAGGAFGAYLIVFAAALIYLVLPTRDMIDRLGRQYWIIRGDVKFVRADGSVYPQSSGLLQDLKIEPHPHKFNRFRATLKVEEEGEGEFPIITIRIPKFREHTIAIDRNSPKFTFETYKRQIKINDPIIFQELPAGGQSSIRTTDRGRAVMQSTETSD